MKDEQSHIGPADVGDSELPGVPPDGGMVCLLCSRSYPLGTRFCPLDGSPLRAPLNTDDELIGTVIDDRYFLLSRLGEGGMGRVYLGEHVRTHRRCAVKVIGRLEAADPAALGRFLREATNAGRISHPHVATVYDYGEAASGMAYLAMEYVDGEPLSKILSREGALSPARAVEIVRQVAEGVAAAHDLGIVHRDLKPGNILVARDRRGSERVKVVDFGIARAPSEEEQSITRTGVIIGTPEYMSPEQLIGDPVDARSDVYALGCILYQMLTGAPAFGGATAQVITRRLTQSPPHARERNPTIPKALDALIVTALGRRPSERFQTMEAFRDALVAAPSQPVTGPRRLASWLGLRTPTAGPTPASSGVPVTGPQSGLLSTSPAGPQSLPQPITGAAAGLADLEPPPTEADAAPGESPDPPDLDWGLVAQEPGGDAAAPRHRFRRVVVVASVAGALVLAAAAVLLGGRGEELQGSSTLTASPQPVPAPALADSVVRNVWGELQAAAAEGDRGEYDVALQRLAGTRAHVAALRLSFPQHSELAAAGDSTGRLTDRLLSACSQLRTSMLARGREAPACAAPGE